jgi:hypothetical protein
VTLRADPGVADELEALATLDRDCCAFAHWSVYAGSTQVVLEVSGDSRETIAAVHGMFAGFERRLRQARTYLITFGTSPGTSASPEARDQGTATGVQSADRV